MAAAIRPVAACRHLALKSAPLGPLRLGYLPGRVPGGQSPSSQHGVDQQACAQQDEADGERGEHGGQRRLAPHLRQLERRVAGEPLAGLNLDCRDPPSVTSSPGGGALHGAVLLTGQMLR